MTHWNVAQPPRRLRASLGWEWAQHAAPLQVCRRSPLSEVTPPRALRLTEGGDYGRIQLLPDGAIGNTPDSGSGSSGRLGSMNRAAVAVRAQRGPSHSSPGPAGSELKCGTAALGCGAVVAVRQLTAIGCQLAPVCSVGPVV